MSAGDKPRRYRATLWRRARTFVANTTLEVVARTARLHPAAAPGRHGVEVERNVLYGPDPHWHRFDLYRPVQRPRPWPIVFYIHGGAFHLASKDTHWIMGLVFARAGFLVVNINYRLAPKDPFPAAIEDACRAWRYLAAHAAELGGDPTRVVIAGESAGGNLAAALALVLADERSEPWARETFACGMSPRAVLPFCAILEASRAERFGVRRRLPWWADDIIRDAGASYLHGFPRTPGPEIELANPLLVLEAAGRGERQLDRTLPPFFAAVGTRDPLLDDTRRLERALGRLGVPCEARYYRGRIHAFHALVFDPVARRCWRDALAFIERTLRST